MKRNCLLCAVLFALVLTACTSSPPTSSPAPEASSPPEESLETSPETSPETLDAAELPELFRSLDPAQAVLTLEDLDAGEFLYYCPDKGCLGPEDEAEFQLVQEKLDWRSGEDGHLFSVTELPVPCHRLPQAHIDEILTQYAGITLADMHTDWREEAFYIPETDCFYSFASDFGPGSFEVRYGERQGDTVTLWETVYEGFTDKLTLRRQGDGWQVLSHQAAAVPGGTEENPAPEHP